MAKVQITEEWRNTKADNFPIYYRTWKAVGEVKATVVLVHGFGEHCSRYDHVFIPFAREGIEVYGYDERGFGRTAKRSGTPGRTLGYGVVLRDLEELIVRARRPNVPLFLFGHSMGGGIVLTYSTMGPQRNRLAGVIVSAPLIGAQSAPPQFAIKLGNFIAKWVPSVTIKVALDVKGISRDPNVVYDYENDPLVSNTATLLGSGDMLTAGILLLSTRYSQFPSDLPLLLTHGTGDMITMYESTKKFYEKCPHIKDRKFITWDGFYHELHNEPEKEAVIASYLSWIRARLNNGAGLRKAVARL